MGRSLSNVGLCCSVEGPNFLRFDTTFVVRVCEIPADPALKIPSHPIFHTFLTLCEHLYNYHAVSELLLQSQIPQFPKSPRSWGLNPPLPAEAAAEVSQAAQSSSRDALANSNPISQAFISLTGDLISAELLCDLMRRTSKLHFPHLIHSSGLITAMGSVFLVFGFFYFLLAIYYLPSCFTAPNLISAITQGCCFSKEEKL